MKSVLLGIVYALALAVAGCQGGSGSSQRSDGGGSGGILCTPGVSVPCSCPGGGVGTQQCQPSYQLGACVCAASPSGSSGGSSMHGSTGTSGGSSSGNSSATSSGPSSSSGSSNGSSSGGSSSSASSSSGSSAGGSSTGSGSTSSGSGSSNGSTSSSGTGSSGAACGPLPADGGCWSDEPDGGPCLTLADCASGLFCDYPAGCFTGTCLPPPAAPTLACTSNGQPCGATTSPCCGGECRSGLCAPWTACGETAAACQTDLDCCNHFACQGGSCQPTCSQIFGSCQTAADCCYQEGLQCLSYAGDEGSRVCLPGVVENAQGQTLYCGAPCSGYECVLGADCEVVGGVDPCAAAGEVCDATFGVCRNPKTASPLTGNLEPCQPFGEPCQPIPGSTAQPVCVPLDEDGVFSTYCAQACATTADCIDPVQSCDGDSDYGGSICLWDSCTSSQFFGPCDAAGTGDGLCYPLDFGTGPYGYCLQASLDGGAAGSRCLANYGISRQNGGFCDGQDICSVSGLCQPVCNAGTGGAPTCAAGQQCVPWYSLDTSVATQIGYCSIACDFTTPDGGGCPPDSSGLPEKCIPDLFIDLVDSPTGVCGAGAVAPIAVGQVCPSPVDGQISAASDPCVTGSICLRPSAVGALATCAQLCNHVGQGSGCPAGQSCQAAIVAGLPGSPTHTGYCQ